MSRKVLDQFRRIWPLALRRLEVKNIDPLRDEGSHALLPKRSFHEMFCQGSWMELKRDWRLAFPDIDIVAGKHPVCVCSRFASNVWDY